MAWAGTSRNKHGVGSACRPNKEEGKPANKGSGGNIVVTDDGPQFAGFVSLLRRISIAHGELGRLMDAYIATMFGGHLT